MSSILSGFTRPTKTKNDLLEYRTAMSAVRYLVELTGSTSALYQWLNTYYPLLVEHVANVEDPHRVSDLDLTDDILAAILPLLTSAGVSSQVVSSTTFTKEKMSAINILSLIRNLALSLYVYEATTAVGTVVYYTGRDWGLFDTVSRPASNTVSGDLTSFSSFLSTVVIAPDNFNQKPTIPDYSQWNIPSSFYESYLIQRNSLVEQNNFILNASTLDTTNTTILLDDVPRFTAQIIFHIPADTSVLSQVLLKLAGGAYELVWHKFPEYRVTFDQVDSTTGNNTELASVIANEGHVLIDTDVNAGTITLYGDLHVNVTIPDSWTVLTLTAKNSDGTINPNISFFIADLPVGMSFNTTTNTITSDGTLGSGTLLVTATDSDETSDQFSIPYNTAQAAPPTQSTTIDCPTDLVKGWKAVDYGTSLGSCSSADITIQSFVVFQNEIARTRILASIPTA